MTNQLRLSLEQLDEGIGTNCEPLPKAVIRQLPPGASLVIRGTILAQLLDRSSGTTSDLVNFGATFFTGSRDHTVRNITREPFTIRIAPGKGMLCRSSR